jgi:hypothetical protein
VDSCQLLLEYREEPGSPTVFAGELTATADADDELTLALSELAIFERM